MLCLGSLRPLLEGGFCFVHGLFLVRPGRPEHFARPGTNSMPKNLLRLGSLLLIQNWESLDDSLVPKEGANNRIGIFSISLNCCVVNLFPIYTCLKDIVFGL